MDYLELIKELSIASPTKIVLMVIDGLGGLPNPETGRAELQDARTPNLDELAAIGICGMADPVAPGITPGSGPGHLAVFGYDPIKYRIGRGALEATGIEVKLEQGDIAARGNFCTIDKNGIITDRRAGRISTEKCTELCSLLDGMSIDGFQVMVYPVREHRFVVVFRGEDLSSDVTESDPSRTGVKPLEIEPLSPAAEKLAGVANQFVEKTKAVLAEHKPANMVLLRGFSGRPEIPTMQEIYKLNPLAIAIYPMYRGLARLIGMDAVPAGQTLEDEIDSLKKEFRKYDFFFLHVKWTDTAGEDGDFARKVKVLEQVDAALPGLTSLGPDVLVVTGDHSTPAVVKGHSWHPVPVLLCSAYCRTDAVKAFSEPAFIAGGLGRIRSTDIMPLAMANALKLTKFGA
jgi:2,3-bisphosphoglycerate-independent phosphoglycerate mutase